VQVLSGPLLGAVSDSYGRKKAIVIICFLQLLPVSFLWLHIIGVTSFWLCLLFYPFLNLPFLPVYFTIAIDIVPHADDRSIAFTLIIVMDNLCALGGLVGAGLMDLFKITYVILSCFVLLFLYVALVISETLPVEKRKPFSLKSLIPGKSMGAFFKDRTHRRLAYAWFAGNVVTSAFKFFGPGYFQSSLHMGSMELSFWMVNTMMSGVLAMGLTMAVIKKMLGDSYTLCMSMGITFALMTAIPFFHTYSQLMVFSFILSGWTQLVNPLGPAITSALSAKDSQGEMQGALLSWQGIANAVGPVLMSHAYEALTHLYTVDKPLVAFVEAILPSVKFTSLCFWLMSAILFPATVGAFLMHRDVEKAANSLQRAQTSLLQRGDTVLKKQLVNSLQERM
jgi:MFS family permease